MRRGKNEYNPEFRIPCVVFWAHDATSGFMQQSLGEAAAEAKEAPTVSYTMTAEEESIESLHRLPFHKLPASKIKTIIVHWLSSSAQTAHTVC